MNMTIDKIIRNIILQKFIKRVESPICSYCTGNYCKVNDYVVLNMHKLIHLQFIQIPISLKTRGSLRCICIFDNIITKTTFLFKCFKSMLIFQLGALKHLQMPPFLKIFIFSWSISTVHISHRYSTSSHHNYKHIRRFWVFFLHLYWKTQ